MRIRPAFILRLTVLLALGCASPVAQESYNHTATASNSTGPVAQPGLSPSAADDLPLPLPPAPVWPTSIHAQADAALAALVRHHWGSDYFTTKWPFAQALDLVTDNIVRTGGRRFTGLAESMFWRIGHVGYADFGAMVYYDDQNWLALALLRLYEASLDMPQLQAHADAILAEAQRRFATVVAAESFDSAGNTLGLWWDSAHTQRATVSNGGAAITAVYLYELSKDAASLSFARRVYAHWCKVACDMSNFAVNDHLDPAGAITSWQFSYNYGVMIGAALALHRVTGEASYLSEARGFAHRLTSTMQVSAPAGPVLQEPCGGACTGDATLFKGIAVRYLAELAAVDPNNSEVTALLRGSVLALQTAMDPQTGHFPIDWHLPAGSTDDLGADVAAGMALASVGVLARGQAQLAPQALYYEAEEAELTGPLGVATGGGSTGWGTLTGWHDAAEAVVLHVVLPSAGEWQVSFTSLTGPLTATTVALSAGAGRPSQTFLWPASSGASTVSTSLSLAAGRNDVSITLPEGATMDIALDALTVLPATKAGGVPCASLPTLSPESPTLDEATYGSVSFAWSSANHLLTRADVIVDGRLACSSASLSCTADLSHVLKTGRHQWYVLGYGPCSEVTPSSVASFRYSQSPPKVFVAAASLANDVWTLTWPDAGDQFSARADVVVNGELVCAQVSTASCLIPANRVRPASRNGASISLANAGGMRTTSFTF